MICLLGGRATNQKEQAEFIGLPSANGDNRIAIIITCHRVIGADGKLVGYGGGVWRKQYLLNHEISHMAKQPDGKSRTCTNIFKALLDYLRNKGLG